MSHLNVILLSCEHGPGDFRLLGHPVENFKVSKSASQGITRSLFKSILDLPLKKKVPREKTCLKLTIHQTQQNFN